MPCALAKCKCDLQQPCSCCIAKKKVCTFADTKSVTAVKVIPADVSKTDCTIAPSTSSGIIFTPDALISPEPKHHVAEKHPDEHYPLDVSSGGLRLIAPSDLTIDNKDWLDGTGHFVDQPNSSCLQDIFFDWSTPPGCGPLDVPSTFSPIYASAETTPLGIVSNPAHILTPSTYLEPENAQQSTGELKRYCTFLICRVSPPPNHPVPVEIAVNVYTNYLPVLHSTWRKDGKSPLLLTVMQAAGASLVKSHEAQELLRFVIEDVTPVLTREIVSDSQHT